MRRHGVCYLLVATSPLPFGDRNKSVPYPPPLPQLRKSRTSCYFCKMANKSEEQSLRKVFDNVLSVLSTAWRRNFDS
jgi:hypothetical protein